MKGARRWFRQGRATDPGALATGPLPPRDRQRPGSSPACPPDRGAGSAGPASASLRPVRDRVGASAPCRSACGCRDRGRQHGGAGRLLPGSPGSGRAPSLLPAGARSTARAPARMSGPASGAGGRSVNGGPPPCCRQRGAPAHAGLPGGSRARCRRGHRASGGAACGLHRCRGRHALPAGAALARRAIPRALGGRPMAAGSTDCPNAAANGAPPPLRRCPVGPAARRAVLPDRGRASGPRPVPGPMTETGAPIGAPPVGRRRQRRSARWRTLPA